MEITDTTMFDAVVSDGPSGLYPFISYSINSPGSTFKLELYSIDDTYINTSYSFRITFKYVDFPNATPPTFDITISIENPCETTII